MFPVTAKRSLLRWVNSRRANVPVSCRCGDGDFVTYLQCAHYRRIACPVDDPRSGSSLQRNLRRGQSDHRPRFGPFPGFGPRRRGRARARSGRWSDSTSSSSSSSSTRTRRSSCRGTTHDKYGVGEDTDVIRCTHSLMLPQPVNGNKTVF